MFLNRFLMRLVSLFALGMLIGCLFMPTAGWADITFVYPGPAYVPFSGPCVPVSICLPGVSVTNPYTLNTGDSLVTVYEQIGDTSPGSFSQYGGSNTIYCCFGVGNFSSGYYLLAGGTLTVGPDNLGVSSQPTGIGLFQQTGGTISVIDGGGIVVGFGGSGTYDLMGGTATAIYGSVGVCGTGIINQTGGTLTTTSGGLSLGFYRNGTCQAGTFPSFVGTGNGTYNLSAGSLTVALNEDIGVNGSGSFTQSGGTNTIQNGNGLRLGVDSAGIGTYTVSGGTLSAGFLTIGRSGTGTFTENGGTVNIAGNLLMGNGGGGVGVGGTGTLNLNGGTLNIGSGFIGNVPQSTGTVTIAGSSVLNVSSRLTIGVSGQGMLTLQDAGSLTVSGNGVAIVPGFLSPIEDIGSPGTGTVVQTGGTHTIQSPYGLRLGVGTTGNGTYIMDGGTFSMGYTAIGRDGIGTFTQNGGTVNVSNIVYVGYNPTATGTLSINGGTFNFGTLTVGNAAGSNGAINLTSGTFYNLGCCETVGNGGTGIFNQTGGTNSMPFGILLLGVNQGSNGTYNLWDGMLSLNGNIHVGFDGTGTFNQFGGVVTVAPGGVILGSDSPTGRGFYNLEGGTLTSSFITVGQGGGTGTFKQDAGSVTLAGGIGNGGLIIGGGIGCGVNCTLGGNGTYNFTGGSLSTTNEFIGAFSAGTGVFNQQVGTMNVINGSLFIGFSTGSTGTYNLTGGTLTSTSVDGSNVEIVGQFGTGTFNQYGGTNTIVNSGLRIGRNAGSSGTYNLYAGTLSVGGNMRVGSSGSGVFNQSGGTANIANTVFVADQTGATGIINLTGGTLTSGGGVIGNAIGSTGAVTVTGPGSWTITTDTFEIGELGQGTLTITNAGKVAWSNITNGVVLGDQTGSTGTTTVTGTGSLLNFIALEVGASGLGTLTVQNGGEAFGLNGITIGGQKGSVGSVTVTGAGSSLQSASFGPLYVGNSGQGTLVVQQGASVTTGSIYVGEFGQGALIVESGGVVSNQIASNVVVIGDQAGSGGSVTVTDTGSHLNAAGFLTVGGSGQGTLLIENGGSVLASGISIGPLGQVTISNGTLHAAGPVGVTVQTGGILRGNGTVAGAVTNKGTVAPGGAGQTLSLKDSYTQTASGTLTIEATPTTVSSLAVGKTATLAGTLALTFDPGTYASGTIYTLVTAKKGVTGTFGGQTVNGAAYLGGLVPTPIYTSTQVNLGFDPLAAFAATPNQLAVASSLQQSLSTTTSGDVVTAFSALISGTPSQLQTAFNTMAGTAYTALPAVAINTLDAAASALFDHWHGTGTGFAGTRMLPVASLSGSGWTAHDSTRPMWWTGAASGPQASPGTSGFPALSGSDSGDALTTRGSGFWTQSLNGNMGVTGWGDSLASANAQTSGTLMGYDSVLSPSLRIGTALGRWQSGLTMNDGTGQSTAISTGLVAAYAQYSFGDWTLDSLAGYTSDTGQVSRPLAFLGRLATATYTSNDMIAAVQAGPRLHWGGMTVLPTFGVDYAQATLPTVIEGGAGSLDLTVAGQTVTSVRGVVGLRIAGPDTGGSFGWTAYVNYGHEFGASTFSTTATLAAAPGNPFTVTGVSAPADTWRAGVGLNWRPLDNAEIRLTYDAILSAPQTSQAGSVTFDWHF